VQNDECQGVPQLRSLRSVAEGKNEAHKKQTDVKVVKDDIEYVDALSLNMGSSIASLRMMKAM